MKNFKEYLLYNKNIYNISACRFPKIELSSSFDTFNNDRSRRLANLYRLLFYVSGQRPYLKKVEFRNLKKRVLKRFCFSVNLNKKNSLNFYFYLKKFYFYFFSIYYRNTVKYNYLNNSVFFYLDNIQYFIKHWYRKNKTQLKVYFSSDNYNPIIFLNFNNLIRFNKNEVSDYKK